MGKSVLVTAYTGTAVDNILINCHEQQLEDFMRVGEPKLRKPFLSLPFCYKITFLAYF